MPLYKIKFVLNENLELTMEEEEDGKGKERGEKEEEDGGWMERRRRRNTLAQSVLTNFENDYAT